VCGIAVVVGDDRDEVRDACRRATAAQAHRGPDAEGLEVFPFGRRWVAFGHRRLSILDLSPLGRQPMTHAATGCVLTFNGEIYNYRRLRTRLEREGDSFRGGSDTEVLLAGLARYGAEFVRSLEGMFAFAHLDPRTGALVLVRDPAGIKPLYAGRTRDGWVFTSEVRAIVASGLVPATLDPDGVAGFLSYGAVQHPDTVFAGISSVGPGEALTLEPETDRPTPRRLWNFPPVEPRIDRPAARAIVRGALGRAVQDHLAADVPVGVFLSAGIDSTLVAGLAARHAPGLRSFTVTFPNPCDEGPLAAATARRFGLSHTEIPLGLADLEADTLGWLAAADQPSIDGLNVSLISRSVRRAGVKVALTGLGADELFGGYPSFRDVPRARRLANLLRSLTLTGSARRAVGSLLGVRHSAGGRAKLADVLSRDGSTADVYLGRRRLMSDAQLADLGVEFVARDLPDLSDCGGDVTRAVSRLEATCYQGNMLLRDADVNSMAFGLEVRVPFLDRQLADFVHSLPGSVRFPPAAPDKILLRQAFPDILTPDLLTRPKTGFVLPVGKWLRSSLSYWFDDSIAALKATGILATAGVDRIVTGFRRQPDSPVWSRAFALGVLGDFVRRNGVTA
jgi:asparagine synthase (glutamine-hydrolysing)